MYITCNCGQCNTSSKLYIPVLVGACNSKEYVMHTVDDGFGVAASVTTTAAVTASMVLVCLCSQATLLTCGN